MPKILAGFESSAHGFGRGSGRCYTKEPRVGKGLKSSLDVEEE